MADETGTEAVIDPARCPADLSRASLRRMIRFMRAVHRLHRQPGYVRAVEPELPAAARFDPGHESVMMGYDFHDTPDGPRLIEVNTNAGGGLLAYRTRYPDFSDWPCDPVARHQALLLGSFAREMALFSGGAVPKPARILIMDEQPTGQFLYPEMNNLRSLFRAWGVAAEVADPGELEADASGVYFRGERVDQVYNRHCDFYLESPQLAGLRAAYLAGAVCLTPNPRAYGLLADKRRMVLWCDAGRLAAMGLDTAEIDLIRSVVPDCALLSDLDPADVWQQRKKWVFKPVASHGSRGVLLGDRMSRTRFNSLDLETTLVQAFAPPSETRCPGGGPARKTDFRLFVYGDRVLGVAARIYRGQVTNFREPGNGYAPVRITGINSRN